MINKEKIAKIIEQTRDDSQQHFSDCHNDEILIETILNLVEINRKQISMIV